MDWLGSCYFTAGRYEEVAAAFKQSIDLFGPFTVRHASMTASYSLLGREQEAQATAEQLLKDHPTFSLASFPLSHMYKKTEDTERLLNALRKAGLE